MKIYSYKIKGKDTIFYIAAYSKAEAELIIKKRHKVHNDEFELTDEYEEEIKL